MTVTPSRARRGTAIVAALALAILAAALLASAAMVASAGARETTDDRASMLAEAAAQDALAQFVAAWASYADSLAIGQLSQRPIAAPYEGATYPVSGTLTVRRLDSTLYSLTADVRVGSDVALARRRVRVLLQRATATDPSNAVAPPAPIARWSTADLY